MELAPGTEVDRYVVETEIGSGGMATVYKVRHLQLGSFHALKLLSIPLGSIAERLMQEGRLQARLRHPNIVGVTDVVEFDGSPGLIMEYIAGPTLDTFLERRDLKIGQADAIARGIISGVVAAHEHGLIHRDLKPGNILLDIHGERIVPRVTDFGLAKILVGDAPTRTQSGVALGTPAYMAPEQLRDAKRADQRADVFALGCLLYEVYTGAAAFPGKDILLVMYNISQGKYKNPRVHVPGLPERVVNAIVGALEPEVDQRIQSAEALMKVLEGTDTRKRTWSGSMIEDARRFSDDGDVDLSDASGLNAVMTWDAAARKESDDPSIPPPKAEAPTLKNPTKPPPPAPPSVPQKPKPSLPPASSGGVPAWAVIGIVVLITVISAGAGAGATAVFLSTRAVPEPVAPSVPAPLPLPTPPPTPPPPPPPSPAPQPAAAPAPVPHVVPEPSVPQGHVSVEGVARAELVSGGKRYKPGAVPAGTYDVMVAFDGADLIPTRRITVGAGQRITVRCDPTLMACR